MHWRERKRWAASPLVLLGALCLIAAGAPAPAATEAAADPDAEMAVPASSDFAFECGVVGFPASDISLIRIWDGLPPDTVSARDAGSVRVGGDRITVYGREASYRPVEARLGVPLIVDLGDRRRVTIDDWVEKPGGGLGGFSYRVTGDPVYLDVGAGTEIYRGRLSGSGFWPPADLTPAGESIELGVCPSGPITETLTFTNHGTAPVSVQLSAAPPASSPEPGACERFAVHISDERTGKPAFDGPLCDLAGSIVTLAESVAPGEQVTAVVEARTVAGVTTLDEAVPAVESAAGSVWMEPANDASPDGGRRSSAWSWAFEMDFEGSPGAPDGFVTFTESTEPSGDYTVVWPAFITDPPAVEVSESGLVCPVVGGSAFEDTWGELRGSTRFHLGVDIPAPQGSPLVAVEGGVVHRSMSALGGYELTIDPGDGRRYYYAHLSGYATGVDDGSPVEAGALVGFVGATGNAAGPHLHLGVILDGTPTNPYPVAAAACTDDPGGPPSAGDPPGSVSVRGHVRYDIDHDGDTASEPGIAGIRVELVAGGVVAEDVTGPDGSFRLGPVAPGTYRVRFRAPAGWAFTGPSDGGGFGGDVIAVRSTDGRLIGATARIEVEPGAVPSLEATLAPGRPPEAATP